MLIIGLSGSIATGKSTVSKYLHEKHGIEIIDADILARKVVAPGQPAYNAIIHTFGPSTPDLLLPSTSDGTRPINRAALGRRIFNDDQARLQLNRITHPAVRYEMFLATCRAWIRGLSIVVHDVPLLFESKLDRFTGLSVVVSSSSQLQRTRLQERDPHLSSDDVLSRIASQMSLIEKCERADHVIVNNGDLKELYRRVDEFVEQVRPNRGLALLEWLMPGFGVVVGFWTLVFGNMRRRSKIAALDRKRKGT